MAFFNKHPEPIPMLKRYRCQYCGNKLTLVPNQRGYVNVVCPCCGALTSSHKKIGDAIISGITEGTIFDLYRFSGSHLQMSQVPEED